MDAPGAWSIVVKRDTVDTIYDGDLLNIVTHKI